MKLTKVLAVLLLVSALPAAASQPAFGAQVQLQHYAEHDDRCDVQINNFTGQQLVWRAPDSNNGQVNAWAVTSNGFAPNGWQSTLDFTMPSSLTTLQWLHTNTDSPFWAQNFELFCGPEGPDCPHTYGNSGWYNFWLIAYPYPKNDLFTDLELAFHVLEAIANAVEIYCGDEEAWEELCKNITEAVDEGNEIANEPDYGWCGVVYADNNLSTPVDQLAYPIIGGTDKKKDHVAVNINSKYVAQVMAVNQASSITGNTQYVVNLYRYSDWVNAYGGSTTASSPVKVSGPPAQPPPTGFPFPSLKILAR